MLSASTIEILKKLSHQELKRFGDFVNSPYFNTTSSLEKIYQIVLKAHPDYTSADLKDENMSEKIFGKGEYKEKRIKNLYSEFGNLLQKFIGYETLISKKLDLDINVAEGMVKRGLFKNAIKFIDKSEGETKDMPYFNSRLLSYRFNMSHARRQIFGQSNHAFFKNKDNDIENELHDSMITLFIKDFFQIAQNRLLNEVSGFPTKVIIAEKFTEAFDINLFLESLKIENHKHYSYLKIYYMLYYYLANDITDEQFYELKKELFNMVHNVNKWDAYDLIMSTNNLIYIKLIPNDRKYYHDIVDLSKLLCGLKIFGNNDDYTLSRGFIHDIFLPAVIIKDYEWAENFAREHCKYLKEDLRENELNYCLGVLSFKKGKYEESLSFLNSIKLTDISQKQSVYFYYLMNYIEMNAYENALSAIRTFKQFFIDNKNMSEFFKSSSRSLKYFDEILRCKIEGRKTDGMIYEKAKSEQSFPHRPYILEKMEKLK